MGLTRIRAQQISDIDYKQAVRVVSTANVTLAGGAPSEVDSVSLMAGDRILVAGQSDARQNGLYFVETLGTGANGTWTRTSDANQTGEIFPGMIVMITEGATWGDTQWLLVTNGEIIIGTTELNFQRNVGGKVTVSESPPAMPRQGDYWIDSDTAIQYIYFNDGNSSQWAEMEAQVSFSSGSGGSGNVDLSAVAQDIIPSANATYSLGNTTNRWANLFLVGNTIDLGGAQIKSDASSGAIALIPAPTANVANPSALVISTSGGINVVETTGGEISGGAIANAAATASPPGAPRITQITVTDGSYDPTGATAVALAGGFVQIVGNGFQSGCQALIGSTTATATGFQSSEILDVQVPAQSAGSYIVYVVNPDGGVGLRPNGITYSGLPTWVTASTLPDQGFGNISIQLEATSDSAVTYALAAGNTLPGNLSLSSAGLISGNVTSQAVSPTTYSFTVVATDAESQTSPRTFDLEIFETLDFDVEYLVIAGGGGTGQYQQWNAGGGAGGYRTGTQGGVGSGDTFTVTVGAGASQGSQGGSSVFGSITSAGGGSGGGSATATPGQSPGKSGGSGGGGAANNYPGGAGNTPSTNPSQGNNGGSGSSSNNGGGGGAGGVGGDASGATPGTGGAGASSSITGSPVTRAAGGAGGPTATNGAANTGNGATGAGSVQATFASGGSGVVILKYPNTYTITNPGGGLTFTTSTAVANYKVTTFTAGTGTISFS